MLFSTFLTLMFSRGSIKRIAASVANVPAAEKRVFIMSILFRLSFDEPDNLIRFMPRLRAMQPRLPLQPVVPSAEGQPERSRRQVSSPLTRKKGTPVEVPLLEPVANALQTGKRKVVGASGFEPPTPCAQGKLGRSRKVLIPEGFAASGNSWAQIWDQSRVNAWRSLASQRWRARRRCSTKPSPRGTMVWSALSQLGT